MKIFGMKVAAGLAAGFLVAAMWMAPTNVSGAGDGEHSWTRAERGRAGSDLGRGSVDD